MVRSLQWKNRRQNDCVRPCGARRTVLAQSACVGTWNFAQNQCAMAMTRPAERATNGMDMSGLPFACRRSRRERSVRGESFSHGKGNRTSATWETQLGGPGAVPTRPSSPSDNHNGRPSKGTSGVDNRMVGRPVSIGRTRGDIDSSDLGTLSPPSQGPLHGHRSPHPRMGQDPQNGQHCPERVPQGSAREVQETCGSASCTFYSITAFNLELPWADGCQATGLGHVIER